MNYNNKKNNNITSILWIIFIILIIVTGIYFVITILFPTANTTKVLDSTRSTAFASDAKSYIDGAHSFVYKEETKLLLDQSSKYIKSCENTGFKTQVPLYEITTESFTSPFGNKYDVYKSYVLITATYSNKDCIYSYAIYLTDSQYELGNISNPIASEDINTTSITSVK